MATKREISKSIDVICNICKNKKCLSCPVKEMKDDLFFYKCGMPRNIRAWQMHYHRSAYCTSSTIIVFASSNERAIKIFDRFIASDEQAFNDYTTAKHESKYGGSGGYASWKQVSSENDIKTIVDTYFEGDIKSVKIGAYKLPDTRMSLGSDHLWD